MIYVIWNIIIFLCAILSFYHIILFIQFIFLVAFHRETKWWRQNKNLLFNYPRSWQFFSLFFSFYLICGCVCVCVSYHFSHFAAIFCTPSITYLLLIHSAAIPKHWHFTFECGYEQRRKNDRTIMQNWFITTFQLTLILEIHSYALTMQMHTIHCGRYKLTIRIMAHLVDARRICQPNIRSPKTIIFSLFVLT